MKKFILSIFTKFLISALLIGILLSYSVLGYSVKKDEKKVLSSIAQKESYWFVLHRRSNMEYLYLGVPGEENKSKLVKAFKVKAGIPNQTPTPLPQLLNREYWLIVDELEETENPETTPYFLALDIPVSEYEPYGPEPYLECNNGQCNWSLPGYFGLHGTGGNPSKLSNIDPGSSGCIRHSDSDITYLYNLLDPKNEEIRYYIQDV